MELVLVRHAEPVRIDEGDVEGPADPGLTARGIEQAERLALAFPDVYEVGMSHLGLQIVYHLLNRRDDAVTATCVEGHGRGY